MGGGFSRLALRPEPKYPSTIIDPLSLGTMHCLGYVHEKVAMFGPTHIDRKVDIVVRDLMIKHKIMEKFNPEEFLRIRETHWGANKGIMKYDGPLGPPEFSNEILGEANWLMRKWYIPYEKTCPVIPSDLAIKELKKDTHPGHEMKLRGFKTKGDVLKHPVARQEVIDSWYDLDHPTIARCSFKGGELLKYKKVMNNDGRVFIVMDIKFIYAQTRLTYSIHEHLKRMSQDQNFPMKIGFSFQYGGFVNLMRSLYGYKFVGEGDADKWDCSMWEWIAYNVILPLYKLLFKPNDYCTIEEFNLRISLIMKELIHTIIVMPSGQVLVKHRGNPSGQYDTGVMNCIWHHFNVALVYVVNNRQQDIRRDTWYLLGDDHIFGTDSEVIASYENRRLIYEGMGSALNKDKDLVSDSPVGHTFLGFTAVYDDRWKRVVPVFNLTKALCSALMPGGTVTAALRYARLTGLRILTFFHPGYDMIKFLARECYMDGYTITDPTDVSHDALKFLLTWPSDQAIERLWLGFEGSGGVGGLKSKEEGILLKDIVNLIEIPMPRGKKKNKSGQQKKKSHNTLAKVYVAPPPVRKVHPAHKPQKAKPMRSSGIQGSNELGPVNMGRNYSIKPFMTNGMVLSGCDFLSSVVTGSSVTAQSSVLQSFLLNPLTLVSGSRLAQFGGLWDKYKFEELIVFYEPSVGSTTAGRLTLAADCDVVDDYTAFTGDGLSQKLATLAHNLQLQVAHHGVLAIKDKRFFDTMRYVEPTTPSDPRLTYSGRVWLASTGGLAANTTYGTLYMKWKIRFTNPNIDTEFMDGTSMIQSPTGVYNSSVYPIGNFDLVKAGQITGVIGCNYLQTDFVSFSSSATLGSVITFKAPGNYYIVVFRTGVAMGAGVFTTGVYTGCSLSWPSNTSGFTSLSFAIAGTGSTSSSWHAIISATTQNATLTFTGDVGVTHTVSTVAVSKVNLSLAASGGLAMIPKTLTEVDVRNMFAKMMLEQESRFALTSSSKSTPGPLTNDATSSGTFSTVQSAAGEPIVNFTFASATSTEAGTPLDPFVVDPIPARKTPKTHKKKFTFVEMAPSDEEEAD